MAVLLAGVRHDTAADRRARTTGDEGDRWIVDNDRRRDATGADRRITVEADVARRMDETDQAGTIDLPHATDRVDGIAPENDGTRIVDLDLEIVDRDPEIRGHRWTV